MSAPIVLHSFIGRQIVHAEYDAQNKIDKLVFDNGWRLTLPRDPARASSYVPDDWDEE